MARTLSSSAVTWRSTGPAVRLSEAFLSLTLWRISSRRLCRGFRKIRTMARAISGQARCPTSASTWSMPVPSCGEAYARRMTDAAVGGCPVHAGFDPLTPAFLADPMAALASLPADEPVFYAPAIDYFVVTRYADIEAVFRDPQTSSAAAAQLPMAPLTPEAQQTLLDGGHRPQPSMVSLDPPDHERLRGPAARAFTPA